MRTYVLVHVVSGEVHVSARNMKFGAEPLYFTVLAVFAFVKYSLAIEADLTIDIEAGKRECFHQFVPTDSSFEVEYQVSPKFTSFEKINKFRFNHFH